MVFATKLRYALDGFDRGLDLLRRIIKKLNIEIRNYDLGYDIFVD